MGEECGCVCFLLITLSGWLVRDGRVLRGHRPNTHIFFFFCMGNWVLTGKMVAMQLTSELGLAGS
jgi:hypothetical protein